VNEREVTIFLLQIAVMLAVGLTFGNFVRRFGWPMVIGELLGGIILGPTILGGLAPGYYTWLFPPSADVAAGRDALTRIGMMLFLFVAGLEVNLAFAGKRGWSILWTSIFGIVLPFGLGLGAVLALPGIWGRQAGGDELLFGVFMGAALSISALPVIARILSDLDLLRSEIGLIVMSSATINDLIGWSLFAAILSQFAPEDGPRRGLGLSIAFVFAVFVLVLTLGRRYGAPLILHAGRRLHQPGGVIALTVTLVLLAGAGAQAVGVHTVFGAFLLGVMLSKPTDRRDEVAEVLYQFVVSFLAPVYFVSVGVRTNFLAHFDVRIVGVVLIVACLGKIVGVAAGARLGGMNVRDSFAVAFAMNARGAIEIILASVALEHGLIDERIFVALVIMALLTSMLSGPAVQFLLKPSGEQARTKSDPLPAGRP